MKYFLPGLSLLLLSTVSVAQGSLLKKQDTVRWFVGHWIDKKSFKIDSTIYGKGGGGGTVSVKADGSYETSTPESREFDKNMNDAATAIDAEEKTISGAAKADEGMYQYNLVTKSVEELEKTKEEFKEAGQKKTDPTPPGNELKIHDAVLAVLTKTCREIEPRYRRIINFYEANKKDKHPHFDLPAPPVADYFSCWGCDTAKQHEFDEASKQYVTNFYNGIGEDANFLLGLIQQMEAVGLTDVNQPGHQQVAVGAEEEAFDSSHKHPGACAYIDYFKMTMAYSFYAKRGELMAEQLWKDNRKNYGALQPVLKICLASLQQKMAVAGIYGAVGEGQEVECLARPIEELYDTLSTLLLKEKDYRLIGTIPFMNGLMFMCKGLQIYGNDLLTLDYTFHDKWKPKYTVEELLAFPKFDLTIDLDTKIGERGNYTIAHLKSKSKVIVELDDKEGLRFTLSKKEEEKMKAAIITNEAIAPGPHGIYVGTKTYTSQSPIFKLKLCEMKDVPPGDSIYLSTFKPLAPDKGNWNVQGKMAPLGINSADRLFMNVEELKNDAAALNPQVNQQQLEDIKKNAMAMAAKIQAMQAGGNTDPKKMAEMVKGLMNNTAGIVENKTAELMRIRLPLKINNRDKLLINQRFDAKEINPSFAQPIVYAYLTVKLEHKGASDEE